MSFIGLAPGGLTRLPRSCYAQAHKARSATPMPKKSRHEKILADIRRRARTERVIPASPSPSPIREHASTFQFIASPNPNQHAALTAPETSELTAIKKDLTKTVVLSAVAIAAELTLYWFGRGKI